MKVILDMFLLSGIMYVNSASAANYIYDSPNAITFQSQEIDALKIPSFYPAENKPFKRNENTFMVTRRDDLSDPHFKVMKSRHIPDELVDSHFKVKKTRYDPDQSYLPPSLEKSQSMVVHESTEPPTKMAVARRDAVNNQNNLIKPKPQSFAAVMKPQSNSLQVMQPIHGRHDASIRNTSAPQNIRRQYQNHKNGFSVKTFYHDHVPGYNNMLRYKSNNMPQTPQRQDTINRKPQSNLSNKPALMTTLNEKTSAFMTRFLDGLSSKEHTMTRRMTEKGNEDPHTEKANKAKYCNISEDRLKNFFAKLGHMGEITCNLPAIIEELKQKRHVTGAAVTNKKHNHAPQHQFRQHPANKAPIQPAAPYALFYQTNKNKPKNNQDSSDNMSHTARGKSSYFTRYYKSPEHGTKSGTTFQKIIVRKPPANHPHFYVMLSRFAA